MTLYILAGGNDRDYEEFGVNLGKFIKYQVKSPKILDIFFASPKADQQSKWESWSGWYKKYFGASIERKLASLESLAEQIDWADVVYFHGGTTALLKDAMKGYEKKQLEAMFQSKIVIGSSAGSNFLSSVYHSLTAREVGSGSGVVPIATIVHYGVDRFDDDTYSLEDWQAIRRQVKLKAGEVPVILLPEGTFTAIDL